MIIYFYFLNVHTYCLDRIFHCYGLFMTNILIPFWEQESKSCTIYDNPVLMWTSILKTSYLNHDLIDWLYKLVPGMSGMHISVQICHPSWRVLFQPHHVDVLNLFPIYIKKWPFDRNSYWVSLQAIIITYLIKFRLGWYPEQAIYFFMHFVCIKTKTQQQRVFF